MAMSSKEIIKSVTTVITVIVLIVVGALFIGTLLSQSVFSNITVNNVSIVNVTALASGFSLFVGGLIAFLAIIGTVVGLVWLIGYFKPLFSKKDGIQSLDKA